MKALEKDRTRRYDTANGLAMDVKRFLGNEPVVARPPSTAYRLHKFVRRNKPLVTAVGMVALALVAGLLVTWQAVRASRAWRLADLATEQAIQAQRSEAEQHRQAAVARDRAQQSEQKAVRNLYVANLNLVQQDYEQGNLGRAVFLLDEVRNDPNRGFEWFYWQRRIHRDLRTFRGHSGVLRGVAISPDGRLVATAADAEGNARLWDSGTGRDLHTFSFPNQTCRAVAFSSDGKLLAVSGGKEVVVWDISQEREVRRLVDTNLVAVAAIALAPDGRQVAMGGWEGDATLWDIAGAVKLRALNDANIGVTLRLAFSPDGSKLLTAGFDGIARFWEAPDCVGRPTGDSACLGREHRAKAALPDGAHEPASRH